MDEFQYGEMGFKYDDGGRYLKMVEPISGCRCNMLYDAPGLVHSTYDPGPLVDEPTIVEEG